MEKPLGKEMKYSIIALLLYSCIALLPSCQWYQHQEKIESEMEDLGVEAARKEIEIGGKSLDQDVADRAQKRESVK